MSDKTKTTMHSTVKNVLPSFDPREPDKAELYVHDVLTPVPGEGAMRQKAETHQPDIISNVIKMPEARGQQATIRFEDAHPPYGKRESERGVARKRIELRKSSVRLMRGSFLRRRAGMASKAWPTRS
jgi:hypothetical protein